MRTESVCPAVASHDEQHSKKRAYEAGLAVDDGGAHTRGTVREDVDHGQKNARAQVRGERSHGEPGPRVELGQMKAAEALEAAHKSDRTSPFLPTSQARCREGHSQGRSQMVSNHGHVRLGENHREKLRHAVCVIGQLGPLVQNIQSLGEDLGYQGGKARETACKP
ncbi:hypothetical protein KL936_004358 [Ogataea polymorpha]|nr:hypothetical protein KL936_004358 [Ogataea polymorpha]